MTLAWSLVDAASRDDRVRERYWSHVLRTDDACCWLWVGAISGRGHGRFWLGSDAVIIAHRFGWLLAHQGVELPAVVRHDCDNPLCQNPAHLRAGTALNNRRDYVARVGVPGSVLNDVRGSRDRARAIRDAARDGLEPDAVAAAGLSELDQLQSPLW